MRASRLAALVLTACAVPSARAGIVGFATNYLCPGEQTFCCVPSVGHTGTYTLDDALGCGNWTEAECPYQVESFASLNLPANGIECKCSTTWTCSSLSCAGPSLDSVHSAANDCADYALNETAAGLFGSFLTVVIVIVLVFILLVSLIIYCFCCRRRHTQAVQQDPSVAKVEAK